MEVTKYKNYSIARYYRAKYYIRRPNRSFDGGLAEGSASSLKKAKEWINEDISLGLTKEGPFVTKKLMQRGKPMFTGILLR